MSENILVLPRHGLLSAITLMVGGSLLGKAPRCPTQFGRRLSRQGIFIEPQLLKTRVSQGFTAICVTSMAFLSLPTQVLAQEAPALTQVLEVEDHGLKVWYPDDWSVVAAQSVNSYTMVDLPADLQGKEPVLSRNGESASK